MIVFETQNFLFWVPISGHNTSLIENNNDLLEEASGQFEAGDLLMPSCSKINQILTHNGYKVSPISQEHIDMENRAVSIFDIETWADSLYIAVSELIERSNSSRDVISEANTSFHKEAMSADVLMNRVSDLQESLLAVEKKEKL